MRKKIILLLLIIIPVPLLAQNYSLKGKVTHIEAKDPVIGANVYLEDLKIGTQTNDSGEFLFNNITSGSYKIKITYIGHKTIVKSIEIFKDTEIDFVMENSNVDLDEVVVTGNPLIQDPKQISQSTLLINSMEMQINPVSNIGQLLNFQPGISMRSNGSATARPVIRGFSNNRVLILENGLRIGDLSNSSDDHAVSSDGSSPEKVEVLRGPASLLYGNNAIGGVINIINEAIPNYIPQKIDGDIQVGYSGVNNEINKSMDMHYGASIVAFHGNYFDRKNGDYSDGNGAKVLNTGVESNGYQMGISLIPSFGRAGISYSNYNNNYGIPFNSNGDGEGPIEIRMKKDEFRFTAESSIENSLFQNFSIKGGYQDYSHQEIIKTSGEIGTSFALKNYSLDFSLRHALIAQTFQGVLGIWGMNQKYNVEGEEALTPNSTYSAFAAYLFEQAKFNNVNVQLGLRIERNSIDIPKATISGVDFDAEKKTFNAFSASFGFVYNISDQISLFANIANAYRSPTIEELSSYSIHEATASFDIGSRLLSNENNIGIDAGLRVRKANHTVEVSAFYNSFNNYIYREPTNLFYNSESEESKINLTTGLPVFKYVQNDAQIYGFELKALYEFSRNISTTVTADYVRGKLSFSNQNIPQMPPFRFGIEQRYNDDNYFGGVLLKLTGAQNTINEYETATSGFTLLDLYFGVKMMTYGYLHMVTIRADNILNTAYRDHLSAIKDFALMPGRSIKINYKFLF